MKSSLNFCLILLVISGVSCSSSQRASSITEAQPAVITSKNLANYINFIPRLTVSGSNQNPQVSNTSATHTFTSTNDTRPLFYLDGVQVGRNFSRVLSMISDNRPLDVKFVKGPRASSRYGEAGKNGVLLIDYQ